MSTIKYTPEESWFAVQSGELDDQNDYIFIRPPVFDRYEMNTLSNMFPDNPMIDAIWNFMHTGGQLGNEFGSDPRAPHRRRRRKMLADAHEGEVGEFLDADFGNDIIEYIDGAIDVAYVALGGLIEAAGGNCGVAQALQKEVLRSNMTKLIKCEVREDGKVQKGPYYQPPRFKEMLEFLNVDIPLLGDSGSFKAIPAEGSHGGGLDGTVANHQAGSRQKPRKGQGVSDFLAAKANKEGK